jgi:hypothetical protein
MISRSFRRATHTTTNSYLYESLFYPTYKCLTIRYVHVRYEGTSPHCITQRLAKSIHSCYSQENIRKMDAKPKNYPQTPSHQRPCHPQIPPRLELSLRS